MSSSLALPLSDIQSKLREKVRADMMALLPPEVLDAYVAEAWARFTTDIPEERHQFSSQVSKPAQRSELGQMIDSEIRARLKELVAEWGAAWKGSDEAQSEARRILADVTTHAAQAFLGNISKAIVEQATNVIGLATINCASCRGLCQRQQTCRQCGTWNP